MATPKTQLEVQSLQEAFAGVSPEALGLQATGPAAQAQDSARLTELASQAPVVRLVDVILAEAVSRRASDIHVEAFEEEVVIRYRIDGMCYEVARPSKRLALALASRLKILANLDVAEARLPQDGRILLKQEDRQIDLRVSSLPTIHGESIVLRVLDKRALKNTLEQLGMAHATQEAFQVLLQRPHGLVLVTGPTGSGKTTTLYACLTNLNRQEVKIVTTEDPVEYDVPGLVQVPINLKIALDFATCLRAILRHDPDIIMVGEIRDQETAQVAVQSALTGHLVFSTLHTNDAPGAVTRLLEMGVEPFLITSTVNGILAQRLVRRLCPACAEPMSVSPEELAGLGLRGELPQGTLKRPVGCDACQGLGFQGRVGLYELLLMSEPLKPLVLEQQTIGALREAAQQAGMRTLRQDGILKAFAGQTSLEEVLRETQDYV